MEKCSSPKEAPGRRRFPFEIDRRFAGVHTGRDVFFMTLANKGIAPVHPDPIDILLRNPEKDAAAVAAAVLDFLETGTRRNLVPLPVRLVRGT